MDIFSDCDKCGKHLVVDKAGAESQLTVQAVASLFLSEHGPVPN